MSKTATSCLILAALGALVGGLIRLTGGGADSRFNFVVNTTGIKIPAGALVSPVEHPTEVEYCGTIDLKSDSDVKAFISLNGMSLLTDHLDSDGFVHKGTIVYDVPQDRYSDTHALFGRSAFYSWEFILDSTTRRVRYEVLVPDFAGDLP